MKTYIVPAKQHLLDWKSFFHETFQEEEHQKKMMLELVTMADGLSSAALNKNTEQYLNLLDFSMSFAERLGNLGAIDEFYIDDAGQLAFEFASSMVNYLQEVGVLRTTQVIRFGGFTGMDIIIEVLDERDIYDMDERVCLSG